MSVGNEKLGLAPSATAMKKSKFTFLYRTKQNKLLMYNSLVGTRSMIKFCGKDADIACDCIHSPNQYAGSKVFQALVDHGMIVPCSRDENALCSAVAWKRIFSPELLLVIMPTEDCNFRCSYCYEEHRTGRMDYATADAIIKYVKKNISKHTGLRVTWFGGEPLMSEDTISTLSYISKELIRICSCARKRYCADIITNGYNLTWAVFEKLLKCNVINYQITIDGQSSTHDSYRFLESGEPTHDVIVSNLLEIKNNCKNKYFNVVIRTNITMEMEKDLYPHYYDLSLKFADDSRFSFFFRPVGNWGGENVKTLCEYMYDPLSFKKIYSQIASIQPNMSLNFGRFASFYDNTMCSACYENSYIIGFDGKLYKCSCHFDEPENAIGYLTPEGNMLINAEKHQKWVNLAAPKASCKACFFAPACANMSCPIYSNAIRESDSTTDDCPYEKKYIKETFVLLEESGYFKEILISAENGGL